MAVESPQQTTAIAKPQKQNAVQLVQHALEARKDMIAKMLPKHLTPERMFHLAAVAMSRNPLLMQCTTTSMVQAIMTCAELGLEPTGTYGGAWLVPYKNKSGQYEAQLQIDYRGLLDLARRSGQIQSIAAHVVYERDVFDLQYGDTEKITHRPFLDGDPGQVKGAYAVVQFKDGGHQSEYMSKHDIEKVRDRSRAKGSGPWVTDFSQMARKTVLRRIFNYLPRSVEVRRALDADVDAIEADYEVMPDATVISEVSEVKASRTAKLKEKAKAALAPKIDNFAETPNEPTPEEMALISAAESAEGVPSEPEYINAAPPVDEVRS